MLLLDFDETARRLGVSRRTVPRLVASGALPVVALGSQRGVHVEDLAAVRRRAPPARHREENPVKKLPPNPPPSCSCAVRLSEIAEALGTLEESVLSLADGLGVAPVTDWAG